MSDFLEEVNASPQREEADGNGEALHSSDTVPVAQYDDVGSDDDQIAENGRGNELEMSDDLFPKEEHNDTVHVFVEEKSVVNQELSLGDSITEKENKLTEESRHEIENCLLAVHANMKQREFMRIDEFRTICPYFDDGVYSRAILWLVYMGYIGQNLALNAALRSTRTLEGRLRQLRARFVDVNIAPFNRRAIFLQYGRMGMLRDVAVVVELSIHFFRHRLVAIPDEDSFCTFCPAFFPERNAKEIWGNAIRVLSGIGVITAEVDGVKLSWFNTIIDFRHFVVRFLELNAFGLFREVTERIEHMRRSYGVDPAYLESRSSTDLTVDLPVTASYANYTRLPMPPISPGGASLQPNQQQYVDDGSGRNGWFTVPGNRQRAGATSPPLPPQFPPAMNNFPHSPWRPANFCPMLPLPGSRPGNSVPPNSSSISSAGVVMGLGPSVMPISGNALPPISMGNNTSMPLVQRGAVWAGQPLAASYADELQDEQRRYLFSNHTLRDLGFVPGVIPPNVSSEPNYPSYMDHPPVNLQALSSYPPPSMYPAPSGLPVPQSDPSRNINNDGLYRGTGVSSQPIVRTSHVKPPKSTENDYAPKPKKTKYRKTASPSPVSEPIRVSNSELQSQISMVKTLEDDVVEDTADTSTSAMLLLQFYANKLRGLAGEPDVLEDLGREFRGKRSRDNLFDEPDDYLHTALQAPPNELEMDVDAILHNSKSGSDSKRGKSEDDSKVESSGTRRTPYGGKEAEINAKRIRVRVQELSMLKVMLGKRSISREQFKKLFKIWSVCRDTDLDVLTVLEMNKHPELVEDIGRFIDSI